MGLDRRADGHGPALADTILVLVIDPDSGHAGVVSVPRDLYVDIPGRGYDRINTTFAEARRTKTDPLALLARVIRATFGWRVERALAIDLGVFERAVDAVGGITIDAPCRVRDRFIDERMAEGHADLDISPGRQRLDGRTAALYVRSRRGGADWTRARRQQAVLLGLREELRGTSLAQWPALWSEFESGVLTDMRRIEIFSLARKLMALDPAKLHGIVIGWRETEAMITPDG